MRKILLLAAALLATISPTRSLFAQKTGTIAGTVVDETGKPIPGVDVVASAENARARSDSSGRFEIHGLESGAYNVRARRLGYLATRMTVDLGHGGKADVRIEMKTRPALLDSVVVVADGSPCPERSYVGFLCRRRGGKGVYLTDDDIFDKNAREIGDIFRGVDGFRIEMRPSPWGQVPYPLATRGSLCLNALVNGLPATNANPIPRFADEMIAAEIYATPSDAPQEYQRYVWGAQGRQAQSYRSRPSSSDRCALVIYWTMFR